MTTTSTHVVPVSAQTRSQRHCLAPARGILVSLGLGAAGWVAVAAMVLGLRALFT